jgi:hypothetical protein
LIEVGADTNIKCHGSPPIILAIVTGMLPGGREFALNAALALLKAGCDVYAKVC